MPEEGGFSRVEPEGEVVEGDSQDMLAQDLRVADGGQGVVVGDEVIGVMLILAANMLADGAELLADMENARGLDT